MISMERYRITMKRHPEVYDPSDDTMLLVDNMNVSDGDQVLEIGIGSGYVSLIAAVTAATVTGIDVNPHAVKLAKTNARLNGISNVHFILGDLFSPVRGRFDLIMMNPPYLQVARNLEKRFIDESWNGGIDGREITNRFLSDVEHYLNPNGRALLVQSSLSGCDETIKELSQRGFNVETIAEKKLFFETLCLLKATRPERC